MKCSNLAVFCTVLFTIATSASGQAPSLVPSFSWYEVDVATSMPLPDPNGVLEPGEGARFLMSSSFTPVGTPLGGGNGTVAGLHRIMFSLQTEPFEGQPGLYYDAYGSQGFEVFPGIQNGLGPLSFAGIQQPIPALGNYPIATNPVIWEVTWRPESYTERVIHFGWGVSLHDRRILALTGFDPFGSPQFLSVGGTGPVSGSLFVPVAPSPSIYAVLLAAITGTSVSRRRQKRPMELPTRQSARQAAQ